jgi:hypothetical protein
MNTPTDPIRDDLSRVRTLGELTMWLAVLVGIAGIVGGLLLWAVTENPFGETNHPYLGAAIGVAAGGIVTGVVMALLGAWAVAWARVALRSAGVGWTPTPMPPAPVHVA